MAKNKGGVTIRQILAAREFKILDKHGHARGSFGVQNVGGVEVPGIALADAKGTMRVLLALREDGLTIRTMDVDGIAQRTWVLSEDGKLLDAD